VAGYGSFPELITGGSAGGVINFRYRRAFLHGKSPAGGRRALMRMAGGREEERITGGFK
jgi:hypothetical protein